MIRNDIMPNCRLLQRSATALASGSGTKAVSSPILLVLLLLLPLPYSQTPALDTARLLMSVKPIPIPIPVPVHLALCNLLLRMRQPRIASKVLELTFAETIMVDLECCGVRKKTLLAYCPSCGICPY